MSKEKLTVGFLMREYVKNEKSTVAIAKMVGAYPEQVRRALKKYNIPVRSRSKASRNFYDKGGENARKGYQFTEEEKERAAITAKEYWLSDESKAAREKISKASKKYWQTVSKADKRKIVERLHQACREASKEGSRAQLTIAALLAEKYDYYVETGVVNIAGIGDFEVDIALPHQGIAIEVDGITHFEQVYSDDRYERAQRADKEKNDILKGIGWSVVRIRLVCERFSKGSCLMVTEKLHKMIAGKNFKKKQVNYVEMH